MISKILVNDYIEVEFKKRRTNILNVKKRRDICTKRNRNIIF